MTVLAVNTGGIRNVAANANTPAASAPVPTSFQLDISMPTGAASEDPPEQVSTASMGRRIEAESGIDVFGATMVMLDARFDAGGSIEASRCLPDQFRSVLIAAALNPN
jgi:hypothetical protein